LRPPPSISQALPEARAERGSTRANKKKLRYFFFAFLAFFAFFFAAFFAFLAIVSSQGFMVKRDTRDARRRASLATSSMTNSADSQGSAPRCHIRVIALSTAQMHFRVISARESASQHAAAHLTSTSAAWLTIQQSPRAVHESKTKHALSQIAVRFR
jgi:heme/copper-type cytochrome/quinol oxidase subunit 3